MADIRIRDLPTASPSVATDWVAIDNGSTRKVAISDLVNVGRPLASQAEAEAGVEPTKVMTPLTTSQAVNFYGLTKDGNLAGLTNTVTARSNLGLGSAAIESASSFQPVDAALTSISGLTTAADQMIYTTAADAYATTALTPFARTLVDDESASDVLTTLGINGLSIPANLTSSIDTPSVIKGNQYRWSIFAFLGGETERAKGSGAATADFKEVFETALATGEKIDVPVWEYPIRSNTSATRVISVTGDIPIDVACAQGARIILGPTIDSLTAGVFSLQTSTLPSMTSMIPFRWDGGFFDASQLVNTPASGLNILDIFQYTGYSIRNVKFYSGISTPSGTDIGMGKCDTAIVTHNCFGGVVDDCDFVGFYDVGVYLSGNNSPTYDGIGEAEIVQNSRFRRCLNGINMKRDHQGQHATNNFFFECNNGILASPADGLITNHGETSVIIGNRFKKMQGRPIYVETGKDYQIKDNIIVDFGKLISDGTTFTTVASGNRIAGIDGRGVSFALIEGNSIRLDDWVGGTAGANVEPVGIQLLVDDAPSGAFDNIIRDNYIYKVQRTMLEGASCDRNKWIDNDTVAATSGTSLAHSIAGTNSQFIGQILMGSLTNDPGSIAAGASATISVPITGAAIGDIVTSYSFSRDAATTQLRDLNVKILVTTDNAQVVLLNNTASAIDLGNTIFTVWIRKAK